MNAFRLAPNHGEGRGEKHFGFCFLEGGGKAWSVQPWVMNPT